jgi:hypothetical protein
MMLDILMMDQTPQAGQGRPQTTPHAYRSVPSFLALLYFKA